MLLEIAKVLLEIAKVILEIAKVSSEGHETRLDGMSALTLAGPAGLWRALTLAGPAGLGVHTP